MTPTRILPPARPKLTREDAIGFLRAVGIEGSFAILGRRGYYRDTMGERGVNDRGLYDDAICVIGPDDYAVFNGNTDPSYGRPGMAVLKPGIWKYLVGTHGITRAKDKQYEALVQADAVTVVRDDRGEETGWFGINIHRGGYMTTGSAGCQTIHPDQWEEFMALVKRIMLEQDRRVIPYVLTVRGADDPL